MKPQPFGKTGLTVPPIIFGTSCLGNLYEALPYKTKLECVRQMLAHVPPPLVLDSAGKYGAGLSLETIGNCLRDLDVDPASVIISNKLGWERIPLLGDEPTFEPGAWAELQHDARQRLGRDGIRACYRQGNELLGEPFRAKLVSVHDPDEYLDASADADDRKRRWDQILAAYEALFELRAAGEVAGVGIGAKKWEVIRDLTRVIDLDWVMLACSLTVYRHPPELLSWLDELNRRGIAVVNSAVFNAGFLVGGRYFDYRIPEAGNPADAPLFAWRRLFLARCQEHELEPAAVCVQFALHLPGIVAVALNTSKPERIADNVRLVSEPLPPEFWQVLRNDGLIDAALPLGNP